MLGEAEVGPSRQLFLVARLKALKSFAFAWTWRVCRPEAMDDDCNGFVSMSELVALSKAARMYELMLRLILAMWCH